jgi:hypothetical protein
MNKNLFTFIKLIPCLVTALLEITVILMLYIFNAIGLISMTLTVISGFLLYVGLFELMYKVFKEDLWNVLKNKAINN